MVTKAIGEVCGECGGRTYVIERRGDRAHARVCTCSVRCSICDGRGFSYDVREETFSAKVGPKRYEVLVPCVCQHRAKKVAQFNEVGLPGVMSHAGFENYQPAVPAQGLALNVARDFAYRFNKAGVNKGFILGGPVGTGKTHLLVASLKHLVLEVGLEARYVEISLLYATIRRGFQEGKSGGEIIGPLSDVEVLAIDELGKGRGSPFEMETLDELIARRYNAGRTTLFATNYSLEPERKSTRTAAPSGYRATEDAKTAVREMELLRERVGERIYSRLCEMCSFVELPKETPDQRRMRQELDIRPGPAPGGMRGPGR
ncbi:ATP-binding protein [Vitiosangium sp. GDMCC 1.1324]|uniref:ATP-binding protein n=1 Tax=Vitiosangium sp. (strain GDMCC 1.1324) TaxID=2138576 RepID=UPI000D33201E|nr:ATP-binding protein [Vitiosangium sp. GDMCC 1.1324]PTL82549.1 DNA replication protein [Vitiosangium sp. GDMCC 1.1324]